MRGTVSRTDRNQKKKLRNILITVIIIAAAAAGITVWALNRDNSGKEDTKKAATEETATTFNPLTGQKVEGDLPARPVQVSIDNDNSDARPQSGYGDADIVYEVPIEGGGSRYEPIFYTKMPKQAGPTRSVRPYIVDIAREYKAILVHNGWSPQAKAYLQEGVVDYYCAQEHDAGFYRTDDRLIPHNQYTNVKDDWELFEKEGFLKKKKTNTKTRTFKWLDEDETPDGKNITEIHVNYYDRINNTYKYNKNKKKYIRYINDEPNKDLNSGKQITCSNILIQKISSHVYEGESERLEIDMTEGGEAYLFTQGKMIKGKWSRKDLDSPTIFKDSKGSEVTMTPGNTWIQLVDQTVEFSYK